MLILVNLKVFPIVSLMAMRPIKIVVLLVLTVTSAQEKPVKKHVNCKVFPIVSLMVMRPIKIVVISVTNISTEMG